MNLGMGGDERQANRLPQCTNAKLAHPNNPPFLSWDDFHPLRAWLKLWAKPFHPDSCMRFYDSIKDISVSPLHGGNNKNLSIL